MTTTTAVTLRDTGNGRDTSVVAALEGKNILNYESECGYWLQSLHFDSKHHQPLVEVDVVVPK